MFPLKGNSRIITAVFDINVFYAALLSKRVFGRETATQLLVNYARNGICPIGPFQLITSIPIIENFQNVLVRHGKYSGEAAFARADTLRLMAENGPTGIPPIIPVASGIVPLETEQQYDISKHNHNRFGKPKGKLFHETQDDRYVLETAIAGRADFLITTNLIDFTRTSLALEIEDGCWKYTTPLQTTLILRPQNAIRYFSGRESYPEDGKNASPKTGR